MSEAQAAKKEREVQVVTMSDGRAVEFAGKRRMLKDAVITGDKVGVRFDFRNGVTETFYVPEHLLAKAAAHGYAQKLGDSVAGMKNEDGSPASEEDMYMEVESLAGRLGAPGSDWNQVSEGGGFGGASVLMKALIEWSGQTPEQVKTFLGTKSAAEKMALRDAAGRPGKTGLSIKQIVERLESEKKSKAAAIDTEALLEGLPSA